MKLCERDKGLLRKMLDEIQYMENDLASVAFTEFMKSERIKRATAMTLINIGELARRLSKKLRAATDIPFDDIIGLRDHTAHGYEILLFDQIWDLIEVDVPELKTKISQLIN